MPAPLADSPTAPPDAAARLDAMRPAELRAWLRDRLHGRDVLLPDDGQQSLAHAVAALDPQLDALTRRDLRRAIADLARQLAPGENDGRDAFAPAAAHELLLLVQQLEVREAGDSLRALAEERQRFVRLPADLGERVLATLVDLGVNLPPSFWLGVFRLAPARLSGLVFDGLALVSAESAVDFLLQVPAGEEAAEAVAFALPRFMDELVPQDQRTTIRHRIAGMLPDVAAELRRELINFFKEEETPVRAPKSMIHLDHGADSSPFDPRELYLSASGLCLPSRWRFEPGSEVSINFNITHEAHDLNGRTLHMVGIVTGCEPNMPREGVFWLTLLLLDSSDDIKILMQALADYHDRLAAEQERPANFRSLGDSNSEIAFTLCF